MCAPIAEGDLAVKQTCCRSAGGLTSSELGTSEIKAIEITSGQVMKHWKDSLSAREALGSKMKSY